MRKNTKKAVCIIFAVLLLVCSFPISAFAVDPVSASVIANSFAQAITAYGASNGVSLTFDGINSGNTEQIGQSVHELWARFRAGQQTADDYDTIAAAVFPGLYNKVIKAGGTAVVGMNIAQEFMSDIDCFWDWLLSGPAEMVRVDNSYQWNYEQNTGELIRPVVYTNATFSSFPYLPNASADSATFQSAYQMFVIHNSNYDSYERVYIRNNDKVYVTSLSDRLYFLSENSFNYGRIIYSGFSHNYSLDTNTNASIYNSSSQLYFSDFIVTGNSNREYVGDVPLGKFSDANAARTAFNEFLGNPSSYPTSSVTVQPYVGDAVARPVPIPDVGDPDYGPLPWAGDLDIPWNDTLFGDGTGTLTDAQKGAITEELDGVIENDGTLVLEGDKTAPGPDEDEDDPPSDDPDDYGVIGLENIFPFCIPFDIYNFLNALAATPTAPHFTATLQLPSALGGAQTIDLDFDNPTFNQLAQLLRLLELLAFIVGLALLTRSMFIRG